jgi:lactate permease
LIGWLGVAITGSVTASNSLFGELQVTAAHDAGLSPTLVAAGNSTGGVLAKMLSPQHLAIAAAAAAMADREGDLMRSVFKWSISLVAIMCVIVYLQSSAVLSWMVP